MSLSPKTRRMFLKEAGLKSTSALAMASTVTKAAQPSSADNVQTTPTKTANRHVMVVGAGAWGGWTALHLLQRGARVTLVDAWGPGNSRASSGEETRIIRAMYGPDRPYVSLVARAWQLWQEYSRRWQRPMVSTTGVLWMAGDDTTYEKASLPILREFNVPIESLGREEAARRFPQIHFDGVDLALYEPQAGYVTARLACEWVMEKFQAAGGEYLKRWVRPELRSGEIAYVVDAGGERWTADRYVFACGPWLSQVLPADLVPTIRATRQEAFYFGPPAGDRLFEEGTMPAWIDNGPRQFYGIPGNRGRGFKLADDRRGPTFDPTNGERSATIAQLAAARDYLQFRFPKLSAAPLLEAKVCQYENSPDGHYIVDRLPAYANGWVLGGGSGHGFKVGPALGELAAAMVLDDHQVDPLFRIDRFQKPRAN